MAAKSDLAQKLLRDLRLRKERMASAQTSENSRSMSRGGYENAGQSHRGSRQIKSLESINSRTRNSQISGRGNKPFHIKQSSGEIVPYGAQRVQNSGKMDLSMAIAFSIENRGKFTKLNSSGNNNTLLGVMHQFGQRSLELGEMERGHFDKYRPSSSQLVTLSNVQVSEISKGIQKINQILKACSNGVNFDTYSIEVGKELLKGAMDLQSSMRMLVSLQEASNNNNSSQRKNRITLLDEDDEDDGNAVKTENQKQLDLPRFSFDKKPSRKSYNKKGTRESEQKLLALTYPEETLRPNEKNPLFPSIMASSNKRSTSIPDLKAVSANLESTSQSTSSTYGVEKGRISNVIAKLMGLDELPQNADVKASIQSTSKKKTAHRGSIQLTADSENKPPQNIDQKTKQTKNVLPSQGTQSPNDGSVMVASGSILHQVVKLAVKENADSCKLTPPTTAKHQSTIISQSDQVPGKFLKSEREPTYSNNIQSLKNEHHPKLPQKHKMEAAENFSPEITKHRKNIDHTESKVDERLQPGNQQNTQEKTNSVKQKLENRKPKGSQVEARISQTLRNKSESVHQKMEPSLNRAKNGKTGSTKPTSAKHGSSLGQKATMQSVYQNTCPKELTPRTQKVGIPTHSQEKPMYEQIKKKKESHIQIQRKGASKNIDGLDGGRKGTPKLVDGSLKQQLPLQVKKQVKCNVDSCSDIAGNLCEDSSKKSKGNTSELEKPEVCNEPLDAAQDILQCKSNESCQVAVEDKNRNPKILTSPIPTEKQKNAMELSKSNHNDEEQQLGPEQNLDIISQNSLQYSQEGHQELFQDEEIKIVPTKISETPHRKMEIYKLIPKQQQEPLTESEKHLKESLIKSHLFLSTAEALLKLNLPVSVLHANEHINQGAERMLTVDCAYEVMKRKARTQELSVYPCGRIPISNVKVISLDDLIKQLCKDFDKLNTYGQNGREECESTQYFDNMLEKDMQNRNPDINSMWDFGWDETTLAFLEKDDIAKDVENQLLKGLIDEIAIDLL